MIELRALVVAILIAGCHDRDLAPPPVDLRRVAIDVSGDVVILKSTTFGDYRVVAARVASEPGVVSVEPMVVVGVTLRRNGHVAANLGVEGIALDRTPLAAYVTPRNPLGASGAAGTATSTDIVIGATLAKLLDAHLGDLVDSERAGLTSYDTLQPGPPRHRQLRVVGILTTNTPFDDHLIFTTLAAAQELAELGDVVTGLEVWTTRAEDAAALAKQIEADLGGPPYEVEDWCALNRDTLHC